MSATSAPLRRTAAWAIALPCLVALGGAAGSEAATLLTSKNVKDDSLLARDFRDGSVPGSAFRDATITAADIGEDVKGPQGPVGVEGPRGPSGIETIRTAFGEREFWLPGQDVGGKLMTLRAICRPDEEVLSGGVEHETFGHADAASPIIYYSRRVDARTWETRVESSSDLKRQYLAYAVCGKTS